MNVVDGKARGAHVRGQKPRPLGHARHAQAGGEHRFAHAADLGVAANGLSDLLIHHQGYGKGFGDAFRGDVVVGGSDAPGGKYVVKACPYAI